MVVTFLRHAEAEPLSTTDAARRLTAKGLEQAARVAKFCLRAGLQPDLILTSPVVRARQTAAIVAEAWGQSAMEVPWLACGMSPLTCLSELSKLPRTESLLLVGHEPDISETVAMLVGLGTPEGLRIRKASLTAVDLPAFVKGCGQLQFLVPARLM